MTPTLLYRIDDNHEEDTIRAMAICWTALDSIGFHWTPLATLHSSHIPMRPTFSLTSMKLLIEFFVRFAKLLIYRINVGESVYWLSLLF